MKREMQKDSALYPAVGVQTGLIGGVLAVLLGLIGMVETFHQRYIVEELLSMGQALLGMTFILLCYLAARHSPTIKSALVRGILCGLIMACSLWTLVLLGEQINLRAMFINASPQLFEILTFHRGTGKGGLILAAAGGLFGLFCGLLSFSSPGLRRMVFTALGVVVSAGVLQDLIRPTLSAWPGLEGWSERLFAANGLRPSGAVVLFVLTACSSLFGSWKGKAIQNRFQRLSPERRRLVHYGGVSAAFVLILFLPWILGLFFSEVLTIVGLYVLLGLGLNIVVGFAGLLDLGYVAFFAIGAYVTALLTSPELGFFHFSFWSALPFAVGLGIIAGVLLGIPVLNMRGDYLAIATLGFGEIIRILVLSDFLRPWLGGAQGIGRIPKPALGGWELATPQEIYYLILAGCLLAVFLSFRLRNSRLGRAWMAIREDEDVAQALGINLVTTKLLAFATGAGLSALSGAIFAAKLGSVYPHSFNVMISINILCLIIVGGMGSIPGVIVGAAALVGLPELLREFAEYRLLVYGAALLAMMLLKPEGLWPEAVHRRELHAGGKEEE